MLINIFIGIHPSVVIILILDFGRVIYSAIEPINTEVEVRTQI